LADTITGCNNPIRLVNILAATGKRAQIRADLSQAAGPQMNILVVDDHGLVREALRGVLKQLDHDAVVMEASNCAHAIRLLDNKAEVELVLLDLLLPDGSGLDLIVALRKSRPFLPFAVFSAAYDSETVTSAFKCGALGFIPKFADSAVVVGALKSILSGEKFAPRGVLGERAFVVGQSGADRPAASPEELGLSDQQIKVLALMMQGKTNKDICRSLGLAVPTVKYHVSAVLRALHVDSRTEAVIAVGKSGWDLSGVLTRHLAN
jgi:DNA-binding NarL/FixJ family response regulator